jgi:phosphoribosylanthranilate isomerase
MPSGPGEIPAALIAEIAKDAPPMVETFLLTASQDPDAIAEQHRAASTTTLQLVARLTEQAGARLRAALPGVRLVQVVQVESDAAIEAADAAATWAHAVLLDSGAEAEGRLGGTGRLHDWRISEAIRERLDVPVILAGGLNPDNVAGAIATVAPSAVDVCTGVRDDRFALDPGLLERFSAAVSGL